LRLVYLTAAVSASGALSPGSLTLAAITLRSRRGWRAGLLVALGHTLVEVPYVALLFYSLSAAVEVLSGAVGDVLTVAGSAVVVYFAALTVVGALRHWGAAGPGGVGALRGIGNPVVVGVVFTGLNAFSFCGGLAWG